jgi:heme/copper-type cytochrome/quinol oxidase subunit 3
VGLWWFIASEIAIFCGAVACYVLYRVGHPEWGADAAHTSTGAGALNTAVLLTSSLAAALADRAAERGEGRRAAKLLGAAAGGGLLFLGVKAVEYVTEVAAGFTPVAGLFWSFYYLLTGLHALHVVAGMVALLVVASGARRGLALGRVEIAAVYWHFVDVVWIFLFPLLYLAS